MPRTFIVSTKTNKIVKRLDNRLFEKQTYKFFIGKQIPKLKFFECPIAGGKYYVSCFKIMDNLYNF